MSCDHGLFSKETREPALIRQYRSTLQLQGLGHSLVSEGPAEHASRSSYRDNEFSLALQYIFTMATQPPQDNPANPAGPASSLKNAHASYSTELHGNYEPGVKAGLPPSSMIANSNLKKSISFSDHIHEAQGPMSRDREFATRRRQEGGDSADEETSILGSEVGGPRKGYSTGPTPGTLTPILKPTSGTRSPGIRVPDGLGTSRESGSPVRRRSLIPPREVQKKEPETWWKRQIEKYGSVELENKGSVARDHLALGEPTNATTIPKTASNLLDRANLPCLASNLPLLRFDRYRHYTTLPPEYIHFWRRKRIKTTPRWETSRIYIHCHFDRHLVYWLPSIFREPALCHSGQVSCKSGKHNTGCWNCRRAHCGESNCCTCYWERHI